MWVSEVEARCKPAIHGALRLVVSLGEVQCRNHKRWHGVNLPNLLRSEPKEASSDAECERIRPHEFFVASRTTRSILSTELSEISLHILRRVFFNERAI